MGASGLGALLVKEGFLTEQDRVTITKTCGQGSWAFAKCILSTGLLDEDELSAFFAERTKYVVAPKNLLDQLDLDIAEQIDRRMVSRLEVLPLEIDHHRITVAVADPLDRSTIKQLEFFTGLEVVSIIAPLSQIYEGLSRLNPEFRPRFTALSNFLKNHAGTAWIKQKIIDGGDMVETSQEPKSRRKNEITDYDEDEVEEVSMDDDDEDGQSFDAVDDNLDDIDSSDLDEGTSNSDFDDIDLEDDHADLNLAPAAGLDAGMDGGLEIDDSGLDDEDPFDSFEDTPKKPAKASAPVKDTDLDDFGLDEDESAEELDAEAKSDSLDDDFSADFGIADEVAEPEDTDSGAEFGLDAADSPIASSENLDEVPDFEDEETKINLHASLEDEANSIEFGDDTAALLEEETQIKLRPEPAPAKPKPKPQPQNKPVPAKPMQAKAPVTFDDELEGLEDLAMGADDDEAFDDPIGKVSPSSGVQDRAEPEIGDLGASDLADIDLSDLPTDHEPQFEDEIPIRASPAASQAGASKGPPVINGSLASLTATAKANEALLRMSLCFDKESALLVAREYLPQISATGCLVELGKTTEEHATWRSGAQSSAKSNQSAAFKRMASDAKSGEWCQIKVSVQDDIFGSIKTLSVYKIQKTDGRTLLLAGDYPLEDETLRDALTSLAEQLGAK